ncbi:MAG: DNA-formamidopyrimidine glycosylase family protein [Candidatus Bathyarchaeota archaeon]|jgi:formamidopyrimidine-DNA glycosylase
MSVELPEAKILADQMNKELKGKLIKSYHLKDYKRLQKIGMMDKDLKSFERLINRKIESVSSRGNAIRLKLSSEMNLILAPEYGGKIFYHKNEKTAPSKFHLKVDFSDKTALTVRLTSMGLIHAMKDNELEQSYVYRRDFNPDVISPIDEEFTFNRFSKLLADNNRMLKSVLVGKDAVVVGLSNSAFQDIIYRAKLHPKRKAMELNEEEKQSLFIAVGLVLKERIRLNGKDQFHDLYGNRGGYTPAMGPNMKQQNCKVCRTPIEKLGIGGGHVYLCPQCQV